MTPHRKRSSDKIQNSHKVKYRTTKQRVRKNNTLRYGENLAMPQ